MSGLSRCGRQYRTFESAVMAGELRTAKGARPLSVVSCDLGDHWHLIPPKQATGHAYSRPDPFPPPVAALLDARDEVCQRCGRSGRLERHHRRAKASGGSKARSHTQCACNGVKLCRSCHNWVHLNPRSARAEGWIVLQSVSRPGSLAMSLYSVLACDDPWLPEILWPTCDGRWMAYAEAS